MMKLAHADVPRPRFALVTFFGVVLLAPATSAARPLPRYEELPVGSVTAPPTTPKPAHLAASESVPGLKLKPGSSGQVIVSADDAPPKKGVARTTAPGAACFAYMSPPIVSASLDPFSGRGDGPREWESAFGPEALAWPPPHGAGVIAIHVERVTERSGAPTLESTDAWVDPTTRGARLIAQASLPLREVASAPGGVKIFAGRDERPDGKRLLQLVFTRNSEIPQLGFAAITRSDGSLVPLGSCAHQRVALAATKAGDSAVVQLPTILPSDTPGAPAAGRAREIRMRPLRINVSVSQTSRDKEPVLAVSTAWAGPEVQHRVFDPSSAPTPSVRTKLATTPTKPAFDPGF